jgi:hypothetical protein
MSAAQQQAAEKALAERDRLYRNYWDAKRRQYEELFVTEPYGERLRTFRSTLNHFNIEDSDRMLLYIHCACHNWLRDAPDEIRAAALEMIGYRIVRIRQRAGLVPFNDPLPDEELDVFQLCKRELGI